MTTKKTPVKPNKREAKAADKAKAKHTEKANSTSKCKFPLPCCKQNGQVGEDGYAF